MVHEAHPETDPTEHLVELVLTSGHIEDFLHQLAGMAASDLSRPGAEVSCGVTLIRQKKAVTVASSDARALTMDEIQYRLNDGPCLSAIREGNAVHIPDLGHEERWPDYTRAVQAKGIQSVLGVPFLAERGAKAGLNLYSDKAHGFSGESIDAAERFALHATAATRLALRIAQLTDTRNDLSAAMQTRTTIDMAAGVIMAQNRCSQDTAIRILKNASSARNLKLHAVAATVIASINDSPAITHFDA